MHFLLERVNAANLGARRAWEVLMGTRLSPGSSESPAPQWVIDVAAEEHWSKAHALDFGNDRNTSAVLGITMPL
jgi:hypothetical protein